MTKKDIQPLVKVGNLNQMMCYSVGPIDRVPDAGKEWRLELDSWLPSLGVTHINPHNKPFKGPQEDDSLREEINSLKKKGISGIAEIREKYSHIRTIDLRCVDLASFLIARIDPNNHMCGTYEEIFTANRQKKPILCHVVGGIENTPNWLAFTLPSWSFFGSMDDLRSYLVDINSSEHYWLDDRWAIFK